MSNIAETVKKQTDRILRQRALNGTEGVVISGIVSGGGVPTVNNPPADLTTHKASADHDGRYYTEAESDARYTKAYRGAFSNTGTIVAQHNLGQWPVVQVVGQVVTAYGAGSYGAGAYGGIDNTANAVLTPSSIIHDSTNQVTVTLSAAATGEVVCVG